MNRNICLILIVLSLFIYSCKQSDRNRHLEVSCIEDYSKSTEQIELIHGNLIINSDDSGFNNICVVDGLNLVVRIERTGIVYVDHVDYEAKYKEQLLFEIPDNVGSYVFCDKQLSDVKCTYLFECYTKKPVFELVSVEEGCLTCDQTVDSVDFQLQLNIDFSFGGLLEKDIEARFGDGHFVLKKNTIS